MEYRFDLDSLRGIALLFVFIYHFNKNILPSGYIGVDIFFILSGYVIWSSNLKETELINFYIKRIIRLYPQQVLCLFLVYVKTNKVKLVGYTTEIGNIISSLLGYSNYHFYYISINYFQSFNSPSNVLHFWSLSLENQFYLIYPILLCLFQFNNIYFILYIILVLICIYESIFYSAYAYYSLSSRINEFIFGSILTCRYNIKNNINKNFMIIGLILFSSIDRRWIKFSFPLPFLFVIEPLIFYLITNKEQQKEYIFNSKLLNFLGKISYSFYLYHYPILNHISYRNIKYFALIFLLTFFISIFTTYLLEKPIRQSNYKYINNTNNCYYFLPNDIDQIKIRI